MNPIDLTLYESPYDKIRVGKNNDGGYVIIDIPNVTYDFFISAGISDDSSFEEHFCDKYKTDCLAFDGTIDFLNSRNERIRFIKKNIGLNNTSTETNLFDLIDGNDNIFLKMDIEGFENNWLQILTSEQLNKFNQMVIEFHFVYDFENVFDKINKTHTLLHFHVNNCCQPLKNHKGVDIPDVFECTFINKKFINNELNLNKEILPTPIDMVNVLSHPNVIINHPPFVNL